MERIEDLVWDEEREPKAVVYQAFSCINVRDVDGTGSAQDDVRRKLLTNRVLTELGTVLGRDLVASGHRDTTIATNAVNAVLDE